MKIKGIISILFLIDFLKEMFKTNTYGPWMVTQPEV